MFPIIIIGMHRSGTTMVASMLDELGLFLGAHLDKNHESIFFQNLNDWALRAAGASWDQPTGMEHLMKSPAHVQLATEYLGMRFEGAASLSFWGLAGFLGRRFLRRGLDQPWGWKDPRTTFTLPLWSRVVPNAKVIHIVRNGVAVAESLRTRELQLLAQAAALHLRRTQSHQYYLFEKKGGFGWSPRCMQLSDGFALWEEYLIEARKNLQFCGLDQHEIRYEDFLRAPAESLAAMARFCGLTPSDELISRVASGCRPERAVTFRSSPEMVAFYDTVKDHPLMSHLGYSDN